MKNVIKINFLKRKMPSTLLGLSLDGSRLEGVVLRRANGSLHVNQRMSVALSLDPLTAEPELVGREILNHLQAAGIRTRHCVVALPLKWALASHTQIPKLPEADIPGFLEIEAERGFPTDVATLQVATSRLVSASGEQHATFVGIPRSHVERLEQVLRGAKLKAVSFSLGITALQPADGQGVLVLAVSEQHVGLLVSTGGGVAALRAVEGAMETEGGERLMHADLIAREVRITMGQLPADLRDSIKLIRIFGPRDLVQQLAAEIRPRFEPGGIRVELVSTYPPNEFGKTLPPETPVSGALSLAARQLTGRSDPFEFLPPRVSAWQRVTSKYAPDKLRKVAAVALLAVLVVTGVFGYQGWQLSRLKSEWAGMKEEVEALRKTDAQIAKYRPWFDRSFPTLRILKEITAAFPENGVVVASRVEIRDLNMPQDYRGPRPTKVNCLGTARSATALSAARSRLETNSIVDQLTQPIFRGANPIQFQWSFQARLGNTGGQYADK
ncbi:MAG TPA: hypothetical protein GYA07_02960 [Verrucomicrobia bacterium]|nr:hypothetical protein [Verrucomicrobiota bacterium]HOB32209.1 hypothetical protein [Verrucomicrobiota bacterium]HOP97607.1 hypothetical protein [Verrucomicrobiota bacterium]HPU56776.1 hypothetical protein [Verrucomicrobiota bacterium]